MIQMCDVVLTFLLITSSGSAQTREVYTTQIDVPKYLEEKQYGQLVNVKNTKPFDCKKGPK